MSKLLSIIVPVYNVEKYLERCIKSIMNQGLRKDEFELIMVNDGSTDSSLEIAEKLKKEFHELDIKIICQSNQGLAGARNTGMRYATGEYLEFIDSDDYLKGKILNELISIAIKNHLDILGFRMKVLDNKGNSNLSICQPVQHNQILSSNDILRKDLDFGSVCANIYRNAFLKNNKIKFKEGITHEDVAFNSCAYSCVKRIMFTDYAPYIYFWNPDSLNRSKDKTKIKKAIIDNLFVVQSVNSFVTKRNSSKDVLNFFQRRGNSIIVGTIINLIKDKIIPLDIKTDFINQAKRQGLYPITGSTLSLKTTLLKPLINNEKILTKLLNNKSK